MGNTQEREKHYWGYRIDVKNPDFFFKELEQGRLRQGWGYVENQKWKTVIQYAEKYRRSILWKYGI